jgi:hypothetical protein
MKLIYLHGPPAAGKYTIAQELQAKIGARVFHNHLTIDVAKAIFDFGSPAFWDLVDALRLQCIMAAAQQVDGVLTYTSCYDHPHDLAFFEKLEQVVLANGSTLLPIYFRNVLTAPARTGARRRYRRQIGHDGHCGRPRRDRPPEYADDCP